jgi:hypothetical protein
MSTARQSVKTFTTKLSPNGCGGCTYLFNRIDGCYHRQTSACQSPCSCPPLICGLPSSILQILYPDSVQKLAPVGWPCISGTGLEGNDESALVLCDLFAQQTAATRFWKRVSMGTAIVSGLLLAGLVVVAVMR